MTTVNFLIQSVISIPISFQIFTKFINTTETKSEMIIFYFFNCVIYSYVMGWKTVIDAKTKT